MASSLSFITAVHRIQRVLSGASRLGYNLTAAETLRFIQTWLQTFR